MPSPRTPSTMTGFKEADKIKPATKRSWVQSKQVKKPPDPANSPRKNVSPDIADVPRGSVRDRIKALGQPKPADAPDLSNTGRTNTSLQQQRAAGAGPSKEVPRITGDHRAFGRKKVVKDRAATKIQAIVRAVQARKLAKKEKQKIEDQARRTREKKAAAKIEVEARAKEAEELVKQEREKKLADEEQQRNRAQAAAKIEAEARAKEAEELAKQERDKQLADEEVQRTLEAAAKIMTEVRAKEAEKLAEQERERQLADEERERSLGLEESQRSEKVSAAIKIQALMRSALTRMRVCQMVEDLIADMLAAQEAEAAQAQADQVAAAELATKQEEQRNQRLLEEQEEKDRREEVRRKKMNQGKLLLFEGPLAWGVGLLPRWWIEMVPHKTRDLPAIEEFSEELQEFEEWRHKNVESPFEMSDSPTTAALI
jgi:hypothetical protein